MAEGLVGDVDYPNDATFCSSKTDQGDFEFFEIPGGILSTDFYPYRVGECKRTGKELTGGFI